MTENEDRLKQLRERSMPEFKTNEDLYAYAATHMVSELDCDSAYKHAQDNLLPVFQAAKELCEYISGDGEYLKNQQALHYIVSMALVSRAIKAINAQCETLKDKKYSLIFSSCESGMVYYKNGEIIEKEDIGHIEENKGFYMLTRHYPMHLDDCTLYKRDFRADVFESAQKCCSVEGNILDWKAMKESHLFKRIADSFFDYEKVKPRIDEFCDMKSAQNMQQIQKSVQSRLKSEVKN